MFSAHPRVHLRSDRRRGDRNRGRRVRDGEAIGRVDLRVRDGGDTVPSPPYCLTEDGEQHAGTGRRCGGDSRSVRAPFFEADPGFERGLARSTVRWMRSSVGRKNRSTGSPSLRARERAVQRRTVHTSGTDLAVFARVPVRDCHPTRRHHARRTLHVLPPDDDARRFVASPTPATHEPHGGVLGTTYTVPYDQEDGRVRNFPRTSR